MFSSQLHNSLQCFPEPFTITLHPAWLPTVPQALRAQDPGQTLAHPTKALLLAALVQTGGIFWKYQC